MRYLSLAQVLSLHRAVIEASGGSHGIRDRKALHAAVAQPRMTFGGRDLYPSLEDKAGALAHSLIANHPFIDGNKRVGHAALETFLVMNGHELKAEVDDAEAIIMGVASGQRSRQELIAWTREHLSREP